MLDRVLTGDGEPGASGVVVFALRTPGGFLEEKRVN
jgi:hypothetical protein